MDITDWSLQIPLLSLPPSLHPSIQMPCCWWIQSKAHLSSSGKPTHIHTHTDTHRDREHPSQWCVCTWASWGNLLSRTLKRSKHVCSCCVCDTQHTLSIPASGDLDSLPASEGQPKVTRCLITRCRVIQPVWPGMIQCVLTSCEFVF